MCPTHAVTFVEKKCTGGESRRNAAVPTHTAQQQNCSEVFTFITLINKIDNTLIQIRTRRLTMKMKGCFSEIFVKLNSLRLYMGNAR